MSAVVRAPLVPGSDPGVRLEWSGHHTFALKSPPTSTGGTGDRRSASCVPFPAPPTTPGTHRNAEERTGTDSVPPPRQQFHDTAATALTHWQAALNGLVAAEASEISRRRKHKLRALSTQKRSTTYAKWLKRSGGCELARRRNDAAPLGAVFDR